MAAANCAETLHLEREGQRPCGNRRQPVGAEQLAGPAGFLHVVLEDDAIGVAAQNPDAVAALGEPVKRLRWEGAGDHVAQDDDPISRGDTRVDKDGVERMHVAVDVGEGGGGHRGRGEATAS